MKVNSYTVNACSAISGSNCFTKILFLFILHGQLFFLHGRIYGQEKTGANEVNANTVSVETLSVWAAPAEQKIRSDDKIESENLIWSNSKKKITVAGCVNEHIPFQVVITNPVPQGKKPAPPGGFLSKAPSLRIRTEKPFQKPRSVSILSITLCYMENPAL